MEDLLFHNVGDQIEEEDPEQMQDNSKQIDDLRQSSMVTHELSKTLAGSTGIVYRKKRGGGGSSSTP